MAKQNRTNHNSSSAETVQSVFTRLLMCLSHDKFMNYAQINEYYHTLSPLGNANCSTQREINANNAQISACIHIINPCLDVVLSVEKRPASWPQVLLLQLSEITGLWWICKCVRLGCIITRKRRRVYILR